MYWDIGSLHVNFNITKHFNHYDKNCYRDFQEATNCRYKRVEVRRYRVINLNATSRYEMKSQNNESPIASSR